MPRLSPHFCLLLSLPWPEGLQIHVSKQKQQENLQFKIFLSKIGTPWRNGEVCTITQLPKTSITLPLRKKPPIIWSATLWPKMDPWNYTVNLLCRSMDGFLTKLYVAIWEHCRCRFGKIIKQYGSTPILHWPWCVFYEQGLCILSMRGPEAAHCLFGECWYIPSKLRDTSVDNYWSLFYQSLKTLKAGWRMCMYTMHLLMGHGSKQLYRWKLVGSVED